MTKQNVGLIRRIWIIALFVLMMMSLSAIGYSSLRQLACEGQPINFSLAPTAEQQIWGERIVSQSFVAPRNDLNRIDILFQTYQRQNSADVSLRLLELPPDAQNPLHGVEVINFSFKASTLQDQTWRAFTFPPIPDSAGKHYLIVLQSPESSPGNAITVGGIEWDSYAPGQAFLGPVPLRADITFRTCYPMSAFDKLRILADQVTRHRPTLWGSPIFYGLILLMYGLFVSVFFWSLTRFILRIR